MLAYVYQGPLASWALPHFIATTGPSDSHPQHPSAVIDSRRDLPHQAAAGVGLPSLPAVLEPRALPSTPTGPAGALVRVFPADAGFTISGRLATGD